MQEYAKKPQTCLRCMEGKALTSMFILKIIYPPPRKKSLLRYCLTLVLTHFSRRMLTYYKIITVTINNYNNNNNIIIVVITVLTVLLSCLFATNAVNPESDSLFRKFLQYFTCSLAQGSVVGIQTLFKGFLFLSTCVELTTFV